MTKTARDERMEIDPLRTGRLAHSSRWLRFRDVSSLPMKYVAAMGLAGATYGVMGDLGHAAAGVLGYPRPALLGLIAWWVPPQFFMAGVATALVLPRILAGFEGLLRERLSMTAAQVVNVVSWCRSVGVASGGLGIYLLSSLLHWRGYSNPAISMVLGTCFAALWSAAGRSRSLLASALAVAALGIGYESTLCRLGLFSYRQPDVLGVCHWIVWLWASAVVAAGPVVRKLAGLGLPVC